MTVQDPIDVSKFHSAEAEQMVLGALLLNCETLPAVLQRGGSDLFLDQTHVDIFNCIKAMDSDGLHVSPVTVAARFSEHEGINELGGVGYLAKMAGISSAPGLVANYADFLLEHRERRDLFDVVSEARESLKNGQTPPDVIKGRLEASLMTQDGRSSRSGPVSMMAAVTRAIEDVNAAYAGEQDNIVPTGIGALDKLVGGFSRGDFIVLGGRPSMGKTASALSIGLNSARAGHGVVIASLEMTPQAMAQRALSEATALNGKGIAYRDMRTGDLSEDDFRAVAEVSRSVTQLPIMFLPSEYTDLGALFAGVKFALKRLPEGKPPLVIVDYLQLLKSPARSRIEQITEISIMLKSMAMRLEVPVLALSQLSRALESREEKRPMLSDLRESGQIEQDADSVIFAYRDEYYLEREEPDANDLDAYLGWQEALSASRNRLELIVSKQRQGPIGTAHVWCNPATNLIWENDQ